MKILDGIRKVYHSINNSLYQTLVISSGYLQSLTEKEMDTQVEIDFVVTWVDGNDPEWNAQREKFATQDKENGRGNSKERFRDWGVFRYWFRAVEIYAPWVRRVYLVTSGHVPTWLNEECPKLKIVNHSDFMDDRFLPTFNSVPIELNLHKIEGISEYFVYFNDDMFLSAPVSPRDFFRCGLPVYCGIAEPVRNDLEDRAHRHQRFSVTGQINGKFDAQTYIAKHPEKWFSAIYGTDLKYNIRAFRDGYISGFFFSHLATPFRKSTLEAVWKEYGNKLDETCMRKFRTPTDIMHQIFSAWEIMHGTYIPVDRSFLGKGYNRIDKFLPSIEADFVNQKCKIICLNDNAGVSDFDDTRKKLQQVMASVFVRHSSFEKGD